MGPIICVRGTRARPVTLPCTVWAFVGVLGLMLQTFGFVCPMLKIKSGHPED